MSIKDTWHEKHYLIGLIWSHWLEQRHNHKRTPTDFWCCVRGSLAVLLGREKPELLDYNWYADRPYDPESCTIAWFGYGTYETDYGTGQSWEYLVVGPWLTYAIGSDGSL